MRPQPAASSQLPTAGPSRYVDAARGRDDAAGTKEAPWRTLGHALKQLKPGDTLYLRGVFYENVACSVMGTKETPITRRSFPGEMAIIDGGFREFFETPATAWEPVPDAAAIGAECGVKLDVLARQHAGSVYLFAVNYDERAMAAEATIAVPGLPAGAEIEVLDEGRVLRAEAGRFRDAFKPLAVHLYGVPASGWASDARTGGSSANEDHPPGRRP